MRSVGTGGLDPPINQTKILDTPSKFPRSILEVVIPARNLAIFFSIFSDY